MRPFKRVMGASQGVVCNEQLAMVAHSDSCNSAASDAGCHVMWPARMMTSTTGDDGITMPFHDEYETATPIERVSFDFVAHKIAPAGWKVIDDEVPGAFSFMGRDARVIVEETATPPFTTSSSSSARSRVVIAFPNWAVDTRRTQWLQHMTSNSEASTLGSLWQLNNLARLNTVICHFKYPIGVPLHMWTRQNGYMKDGLARSLCATLMKWVQHFSSTPVRFWGLLLPSMIFLSEAGRLTYFLPLGAVLSWPGVQSTCLDIDTERLAPEIATAVTEGSRGKLEERGRATSADAYSVAALVLEAMAGVVPSKIKDVHDMLSDDANDFLRRLLYKDPAWRLSVGDALEHPWLQQQAPRLSRH